MSQAGSINYEVHVPWLQGRGLNVYTQFGEDGLIGTCLQRIGETNRQCFEIGAHDGRFFSNTLRLREQGWLAVLIESDERHFQNLISEFGNESICIQATCTDLDKTLLDVAIDENPDLGVIDIDGQDYWLWHDMWTIEPRVMLVEISTQGPSMPIPARGEPYPAQAGLDAITELGKSKGYTLVATTFCNALFVKTECL
jgi:hypothetical protein